MGKILESPIAKLLRAMLYFGFVVIVAGKIFDSAGLEQVLLAVLIVFLFATGLAAVMMIFRPELECGNQKG